MAAQLQASCCTEGNYVAICEACDRVRVTATKASDTIGVGIQRPLSVAFSLCITALWRELTALCNGQRYGCRQLCPQLPPEAVHHDSAWLCAVKHCDTAGRYLEW